MLILMLASVDAFATASVDDMFHTYANADPSIDVSLNTTHGYAKADIYDYANTFSDASTSDASGGDDDNASAAIDTGSPTNDSTSTDINTDGILMVTFSTGALTTQRSPPYIEILQKPGIKTKLKPLPAMPYRHRTRPFLDGWGNPKHQHYSDNHNYHSTNQGNKHQQPRTLQACSGVKPQN